MATYRRVTKAENPAAHKAKRYTAAAPGKFRASSKTIPLRQFLQTKNAATKGKTIETRIRERRASSGYTNASAHKAMITRGRNKELQSLYGFDRAKLSPSDNALINEYLDEGGFNEDWSDKKKLQFRALFYRYPDDLVRGWLGSSLESRRARQFRSAA